MKNVLCVCVVGTCLCVEENNRIDASMFLRSIDESCIFYEARTRQTCASAHGWLASVILSVRAHVYEGLWFCFCFAPPLQQQLVGRNAQTSSTDMCINSQEANPSVTFCVDMCPGAGKKKHGHERVIKWQAPAVWGLFCFSLCPLCK